MKSFKQVLNEVACDAPREQDDMTIRELQVAVNAAQEIITMLQSGASMERWGESKVTLASDYLVSVCTYMRAHDSCDDQFEDEEIENEQPSDNTEYVGHEYTHLQQQRPLYPFFARIVAEGKKS